jgi:hypothetical protein
MKAVPEQFNPESPIPPQPDIRPSSPPVVIEPGVGAGANGREARAGGRESWLTARARSRFRWALILAVVADLLQLAVFPLFAEGAISGADDVLDIAVASCLLYLLGWHWEFLPSFAFKLIPMADEVPFWTLSVFNVYRRWKQIAQAVARQTA